LTEKPDGRIREILEILKSDAAFPELMLIDPADAWRFKRKILAEELGLIADNDDTLTTAGKKNRSWIMFQAALRSMGNIAKADEIENLRLYYRNVEETTGPLSAEQMHKWHVENLRIFMESGLTLSAIEQQVQKDAEMYPEAIDLLKYLLDRGATVCIVSAGIAAIIRLTLKKHGLDPDKYRNLKIFAIELKFSFGEEGRLIGYFPPSIVTLESKGPLAKAYMKERGIRDENVIGIGDGLTDAEMLGPFSKEATMVLFVPAHKIGDLKEANFVKMSGRVHAVAKKDFGIFAEKIKEMTS